eukprot:Skav208262  [mRNA]  locus=scaffold188:70310:79792:+ [translate_table: standard]
MAQSSPHIEAAENGFAYWGRKLLFSLNEAGRSHRLCHSNLGNRSRVTVEAFDKRELQGALRGDSFIGRAELQVETAQLGSTPQRQVPLQTVKGQDAGQLFLGFQIFAPQEAFRIMAHSSDQSLAAAAKAFAQTLRQPGALDHLLAARPQPSAMRMRLDAIRNLLRTWLGKFCEQSLRMSGDESDENAIDSLWQLARSAQDLGWWSRKCASLPKESPEELAFALAARLEEAERGNEMEEIVQNGRLKAGMAAVVRSDSDATWGRHVFIYEHSSIVSWQAQDSSDPCTRCALSAGDIIRIS